MTWKLRTRLDAMPSMIVHDAQVTGWVRNRTFRDYRGQKDAEVMAVAQVDNSSMTIRALVGPDDLNVVVTKPVVVRRSVIPDTVTDRRILMADPENVMVQIDAVDAWRAGYARGMAIPLASIVELRAACPIHLQAAVLEVSRKADGWCAFSCLAVSQPLVGLRPARDSLPTQLLHPA